MAFTTPGLSVPVGVNIDEKLLSDVVLCITPPGFSVLSVLEGTISSLDVVFAGTGTTVRVVEVVDGSSVSDEVVESGPGVTALSIVGVCTGGVVKRSPLLGVSVSPTGGAVVVSEVWGTAVGGVVGVGEGVSEGGMEPGPVVILTGDDVVEVSEVGDVVGLVVVVVLVGVIGARDNRFMLVNQNLLLCKAMLLITYFLLNRVHPSR